MAPNQRKKSSLSGGFQPINTLPLPPSESSSTRHTTARFLPPAHDVDDDVQERKLDESHIASSRPRRPQLLSQGTKRPHPGALNDGRVPIKVPRRGQSPDPVAAADILNTAARQNPNSAVMERKPRGYVSSKNFQRDLFHPTPETVEDDSDELTHDAPRPFGRSKAKGRPSADIQHTDFKSPRVKFAVHRAACGNSTYDATESGQKVYLVPVQGDTLVPVDANFERINGLSYLKINLRTLHRVVCASEPSPLRFHRASGKEGGGSLALELMTDTDHRELLKWIDARAEAIKGYVPIRITTMTVEKMTTMFEKLYEQSGSRTGQQETQEAANDMDYLEAKEAFREEQKAATSSVSASAVATAPCRTPNSRLRNGMRSTAAAPTSAESPDFIPLDDADDDKPQHVLKRATRSGTAAIPFRSEPEPKKWIDENPTWKEIWDDRPLIYPPTGRNQAQVAMDDITRLEEGSFLNDNLIVFYSRYLQTELEKTSPETSQRIYVMNPWFYEKLTKGKGRGINYEAVKSWTAKVDLFRFDYVIVPVNEHAHWYLAIICNPGKLIPQTSDDATAMDVDAQSPSHSSNQPLKSSPRASPDATEPRSDDALSTIKSDIVSEAAERPAQTPLRKKQIAVKQKKPLDAGDPRVITLDSLGSSHSVTCTNLREYLVQEARNKQNVDLHVPSRFGFTARGIPEQADVSSCGAYLLGYMEEFFKSPDDAVQKLVLKQTMNWQIDPSTMRTNLRSLIINLRGEQNARLRAEKEEKEEKRRAKAAGLDKSKGADGSSPAAQQSPGTSDPADTPKAASDRPSSGIPSGAGSPRDAVDQESHEAHEVQKAVESFQPSDVKMKSPQDAGPAVSSFRVKEDTKCDPLAPSHGITNDAQKPFSLLKRLESTPPRQLERTPDREVYRSLLDADGEVPKSRAEDEQGASSESSGTLTATTPTRTRRSNRNNPIEISDESPVRVSRQTPVRQSAYFTIDLPAKRHSPRRPNGRVTMWEKPGRPSAERVGAGSGEVGRKSEEGVVSIPAEKVHLDGNPYRYQKTVDLTEDD